MDADIVTAIHEELERAQRLSLQKLLEMVRLKELALRSPLPAAIEPVDLDFTGPFLNFLEHAHKADSDVDDSSITSTFIPIKASEHCRQVSSYSTWHQPRGSRSNSSDSSGTEINEGSEVTKIESTDSMGMGVGPGFSSNDGVTNMSGHTRTMSAVISSTSSLHRFRSGMGQGMHLSGLLGSKMLGDQAFVGHMACGGVSGYQDAPQRIGKLVRHVNGLWFWESPPSKVVLVTKPNDIESEWHLKHIFAWFARKSITVYVDPLIAQRYTGITAFDPELIGTSNIDLVISIGGDGTLLYINSLFQQYCPPILAFNCGSLGFLTPFSPKDIDKKLSHLFDSPVSLIERTRLSAMVTAPTTASSNSKSMGQTTSAHSIPSISHSSYTPTKSQPIQRQKMFTVLNEIAIMRQESKDASDPICTLDTYVNSKFVTTIQADGALISTPSGSTAYALSAGGIPVHPTLECMLLTFICPHVMSGRQVCLPGNCVLKLKQPRDSRGSCAASFDNRARLEILRGESLQVRVAEHCFPTINEVDSSTDWFRALVRCLGWNVRIRQKAFDARNAVREKSVGDTDSDEQ